MDLSDGLADAVRQVAEASGVGARDRRRTRCRFTRARRDGFAGAARTPSRQAFAGATTTNCCSPSRPASAAACARRAAGPRLPRHADRRADRAIAGSSSAGRRRRTAAGRLRPLLTASDGWSLPHTAVARAAASHPRHAAADGGGVRPGRFLRVLAVARAAHRARSRLAFVFGLNRVAVLLGVYSNLPWILPAYYTLATIAGAAVLGVDVQPGRSRRRCGPCRPPPGASSAGLARRLAPLMWAYILGSTVGALLLAAVAYRVSLAMILAHRKLTSQQARRNGLNHGSFR